MSIVSKKLKILVAEPLDFESSAGKNILRGVVSEISEVGSARQWVLCHVDSFSFKDTNISNVLLVQRYSKEPVVDFLQDLGQAGCNCLYSPENYLQSSGDIIKMLDDPSPFFIAGRAILDH
mgnify:CR=1 FL=1